VVTGGYTGGVSAKAEDATDHNFGCSLANIKCRLCLGDPTTALAIIGIEPAKNSPPTHTIEARGAMAHCSAHGLIAKELEAAGVWAAT
jgi:hypothetical protein